MNIIDDIRATARWGYAEAQRKDDSEQIECWNRVMEQLNKYEAEAPMRMNLPNTVTLMNDTFGPDKWELTIRGDQSSMNTEVRCYRWRR